MSVASAVSSAPAASRGPPRGRPARGEVLEPDPARRAAAVRPALVTQPFLLLLFVTLAYFVAIGMVLPVLPRYVEGPLGGGSAAVGAVIGSFSLSAVVLRPLAGRLGDARGRRVLVLAGGALVAASILAHAVAASIPVLVGLRVVAGAGEALFFTGAASAANDVAPESRRGEALSYFSLALYGGLALGPLLGEALLDRLGFGAVWAAAGASAAAGVVLGLRLRDPRLRPVEAPAVERGPLLHRAALLPGLVLAASIWGFAGLSAFVPLYALDLGLSGSRFVFLLYSLLILAVRLLGARLPDRLGARRMVVASLTVSIAGLLVTAAWASPAGLLAGVAVLALGQSLAFPALMAVAVRGAPASERGSVIGSFTAFFDVGFGVGAASLGAVAAATGYRGAFVVAALVTAGGLALIASSRRRGAPATPSRPAPSS